MLILSIETSCDETSVAILSSKHSVLATTTASSSDLFIKTGGVVPEVAAREQLKYIIPVIEKTCKDANVSIKNIDYFAVTIGPGLIGSLFVGVNAVKTLSAIYNKKVICVNHLLGHIYSVQINKFLGKKINSNKITYPSLALVVSGGHTDLVLVKSPKNIKYLGGTIDDAAGECFDKVARILGLSKYLGGKEVSQLASQYSKSCNIDLPRPLLNKDNFNFSFSGLKTAVLYASKKVDSKELAFCFEEAVIDVLLSKTKKAYSKYKPKQVILCGGVSANTKLRQSFASEFGNKLLVPPIYLCTDNASMIGSYAFEILDKAVDFKDVKANPNLSLTNIS